jgi:hypothetical protein
LETAQGGEEDARLGDVRGRSLGQGKEGMRWWGGEFVLIGILKQDKKMWQFYRRQLTRIAMQRSIQFENFLI